MAALREETWLRWMTRQTNQATSGPRVRALHDEPYPGSHDNVVGQGPRLIRNNLPAPCYRWRGLANPAARKLAEGIPRGLR